MYIIILKSPGSLEFLKAAEEKFLMGEVSYDSLKSNGLDTCMLIITVN